MAIHVVHDAATKGFDDAKSYDAYRPSYPANAVTSLLKHLGLEGKQNAKIVDLAAGTGKFTEALAARPEKYEIIAVEPLDSMRETLAAKKLPGVGVRDGTAEDFAAVETGSVDAVLTAQAFHWFANETALKEIHRALKPGGKLGMIWNVEDYNGPREWTMSTQWERSLNDLSWALPQGGQPRFRHYVWPEVFAHQTRPLFQNPIETDRVPWSVWLTKDALWDRLRTLSFIAVLKGDDESVFREKFEQLVTEGDGKMNEKNEVEIHGHTFFAWTTKL